MAVKTFEMNSKLPLPLCLVGLSVFKPTISGTDDTFILEKHNILHQ